MSASSLNDDARVVVTGMGCIFPGGNCVGDLWSGILSRRQAIRTRTVSPGAKPLRCHLCSEIDQQSLADNWPIPGMPGPDPTCNLLSIASDQALRQAGMLGLSDLGTDVPVIIGSGAGANYAVSDAYRTYFEQGPDRIRPTTVPRCMTNSLSARIAIRYGLTGANYVINSACASATVAIGTAFRMLRHGYVQRVLCGGVDTLSDPIAVAAWDRLGVLTRRENPADAVLPFDRRRDGFVLGEGAAVLVLENLASARRRGVPIFGEIAGYGESSDALHLTQPDAAGQVRSILQALEDASVGTDRIDLIVPHGTATTANDRSEAQALQQVFGNRLSDIPVLTLKALWGHLLGASGAVEALAALVALESGIVPPDPLPYREADQECNLRFCPSDPEPRPLRYILKNSFAFGGNNAVLVLRRFGEHDCSGPL